MLDGAHGVMNKNISNIAWFILGVIVILMSNIDTPLTQLGTECNALHGNPDVCKIEIIKYCVLFYLIIPFIL